MHSFPLYPWPVCQTRWFYFTGTQGEKPSPSASPVFSYHYKGPYPTLEHWIDTEKYDVGQLVRINENPTETFDWVNLLRVGRLHLDPYSDRFIRGLIRYDLSSIPPEQTVIEAVL